MRLVKRLIELAFVILVISLFMKNKDVELQINYFFFSCFVIIVEVVHLHGLKDCVSNGHARI